MSAVQYEKPIIVFESEGFLVFHAPTHPLARKNGIVAYHRHLLSIYEEHWLTSDEMVIFRDGNSLNVALENMEIVTRSDLIRRFTPFHQEGRTVEIVCIRPGCGNTRRLSAAHAARAENHYCSQECLHLSQRKFDPTKE